MFACIHGPLPDLPQIAEAFSPTFEQTAPGTVVFRVDGLKRLYGSLHQIAQAIANHADGRANVAIAETADAAILAAHNFSGITVTPKLDHLNVESLPITDELGDIFESWGIRTLAQLAQLPETGIAERFGPTGVYLQRLAKGTINRPLKIFQPEITYQDRIELDHSADLLEPLLFLIARMLNDQCEKLLSHAMAASEITIRLELENKTDHVRILRLPVPMRDSKSLLKLLQMDLEAHPPQSATTALSLSLKAVNPRTIQSDIFLPATPAPDKLELTLARIRAIVGESNVGIPELLNTHHPHPYHLITSQPQLFRHQPPVDHQQPTGVPLSPSTTPGQYRTRKQSPIPHHRSRHSRKNPKRRRPVALRRKLVDHNSMGTRRMGRDINHRPLPRLPRKFSLVRRRHL